MKLFRELSPSPFISKFQNLMKTGELEGLSEYLEILKKILRKDFPEKAEIEKYVPKCSKVRKKYKEAVEELGTVPQPADSRKVYLKISERTKYDSYKKRAEKTLANIEAIESIAGKIKKLQPYSSRRTPTGLPARLLNAIYTSEMEGKL